MDIYQLPVRYLGVEVAPSASKRQIRAWILLGEDRRSDSHSLSNYVASV